MRNKTGKLSGFILGTISFLLLFKVLFLNNIPPEDELAPGIVVFAAIMNGVLCGYIGSLIQRHYIKKTYKDL